MKLNPGLRAVIGLIVLVAFGLAAKLPWEKPTETWSAEDVAAILNNSPWSIRAVAVMHDPRDDRDEDQPVAPPDTGNDTGKIGAPKTHWDGEIGRNRMGSLATIPVTVRWESALPVRLAEKASITPLNSYVISLVGIVPANRYNAVGKAETSSSSDGSVDPKNPEEVLEAFMAYSRIVQKGVRDIEPEDAKLDPSTGTVRIFFPRSRVIDPEQKEILFVTHFGNLNVRVKFRVSTMKYHGAIEL